VDLFGQTFSPNDLVVIGLLVVLEGVLSVDNALVLGLLAKRLPKRQQGKALTYGLAGAFVFRFIAIGTAAYLLQWRIVKLLGGGYLLWVALKHYIFEARKKKEEHVALGPDNTPTLIDATTGRELTPNRREQELRIRSAVPVPSVKHAGFWSTIAVIELTDIAFAIDSILAAIALVGSAPAGHVGPHPKLWVVITGGMLGVILMRFAAVLFIKLLDRFPRFETSAYLLVSIIGLKLVVDWGLNTPADPHRVDFHSFDNPAFWIFWILMLLCFAVGFLPQKKAAPRAAEPGRRH
jgi:YkoY family integral membrane protein